MHRYYAILTIILFCVPTLVVGFTNTIVDPIQVYHKSFLEKHWVWDNQRYQNAGKIKSYLAQDGYDSLILGNSVTDCILSSQVHRYMGWNKVLKLTVDGGTLAEQAYTLEQALSKGGIRNVLWGHRAIHTAAPRTNIWNKKRSLPRYLYTQSILDDAPYLFNLGMFVDSINIVMGRSPSGKWMSNKNGFDLLNYWMTPRNIESFAKYQHTKKFKKLKKKAKKATYSKVNLNKEKQFPAIDEYIIRIVKKYPDCNFILFFSPESLVTLQSRGNNLSMYFAPQRYLVNKLADLPNAKVFGFEADSKIIKNLAHYRDEIHFHSGVSKLMLQKMASNQDELTADNIDAYINTVFSEIKKTDHIFDYESMIPMLFDSENELHRSHLK